MTPTPEAAAALIAWHEHYAKLPIESARYYRAAGRVTVAEGYDAEVAFHTEAAALIASLVAGHEAAVEALRPFATYQRAAKLPEMGLVLSLNGTAHGLVKITGGDFRRARTTLEKIDDHGRVCPRTEGGE